MLPAALKVSGELGNTLVHAGTLVLWGCVQGTLVSLWWCQRHVISPQNPRDADPMTRVQAELDETKIILVRLQGHGRTLLPAQASGPWGHGVWQG